MTRMFNPAHPGDVLREFLPATMTVGEVASELQVSRVQLSRILNGRSAVSADMAIRIGKLTGTTAESGLRIKRSGISGRLDARGLRWRGR